MDPVAKPRKPTAELRVYWSKREKALMYDGCKPTGGLLYSVFERTKLGEMFERLCGVECKRNGYVARINEGRPVDPMDLRGLAKELEARGYDLTTFRFQIRKKQP